MCYVSVFVFVTGVNEEAIHRDPHGSPSKWTHTSEKPQDDTYIPSRNSSQRLEIELITKNTVRFRIKSESITAELYEQSESPTGARVGNQGNRSENTMRRVPPKASHPFTTHHTLRRVAPTIYGLLNTESTRLVYRTSHPSRVPSSTPGS